MPTSKNFFVSYARADSPLPGRLLELLRPRLAIARGFDFSHWIDEMIPVGAQWRTEIDAALGRCDFGLLLLSPSFFASPFIASDEIPRFIGTSRGGGLQIHKPIVPVGLKPVPLDGSADLKGLDQTQIFRDDQGRWFHPTSGHVREAFADQLVAAILTKLRTGP